MKPFRTWRRATTAVVVLAAAFTTVAVPANAAVRADGERSITLHQAVAVLSVAAEDRTGYNREQSLAGGSTPTTTAVRRGPRSCSTKPSRPPPSPGSAR